jgi:prolyl oligopeptidase
MSVSLLWITLAWASAADYAQPALLIEPTELAKVESVVILDVRSKKDFAASHIPNALWLDAKAWDQAFNSEPNATAWGKRLGEIGISLRKPVVVYGDDDVRDAARIWWILRYWGVHDVRLLNGGWPAWPAAGEKTSSTLTDPQPQEVTPTALGDRLATKRELLEALKGQPPQIIDARSEGEYCGLTTTAKRNGSIPGAVPLEWKDCLDPKTKRFKMPTELAKLLEERKIDVDKPAVTYCQSGGRAAVVAFTLELTGGRQVKNYYKSWSEWGNADDTPVQQVEPKKPAPPLTKKEAVRDTYHGIPVTDDYRWLEDGNNPQVRAWSDAQNAYARRALDRLPGANVLRTQLTKIMAAKTTSHGDFYYRGGQLFAIRRQPPKQQPFLVVLPAPDRPDQARLLVDPNELDEKGTTAIDWYVPSPDGRLVAVSLSQGGTETGDVHVYDTTTAKELYEVIPRVNGGTAGGDLAWTPDGKGFFYTRYPRGKERPPEDIDFYQQVFFHQLGSPTEQDRYEMGKDLPRIAEIKLETDDATGRLLATVQNGDGGEFAFFLRETDGDWRQFSTFKGKVVQAAFGRHDDLFVVSLQDAPRGKLLRLSVRDLDAAKAPVVVPEGKDTIVVDFPGFSSRQTVLPTANLLYVTYQTGGPTELRCFDFEGKPRPAPKQLPISTVGGLAGLTGDDILFSNGSYVEPRSVYRFRPEANETVKLPLTTAPPVDLSDVDVVREFAVSKDGTKVPVNIMIPKGVKRDGTNPCLVTGYGGYGISRAPGFVPERRILFDHGFIVAEANLRGGAEYGEAWHRAGALTHKQNVFNDFAAVLQHLIDRHYTAPEHLAIMGGSNGGLLMGATLTQHAQLMKAVVSLVGIYDMLRVELSPNGAFNVPEFGTVKDEPQFRAMYAYSPFHHVQDRVKYPAVLFLTGANDPRVDPMQSRKMTARLQAATSGRPVLLRTSGSSGHGLDTPLSERIEEEVDVYAFLFAELCVKVKQ